MTRFSLFTALALIVVFAARGEDVPRFEMRIRSDILTELPGGAYSLATCDSHGNIYIRPVRDNVEDVPIIRVDNNGKVRATYRTSLPSGVNGPSFFRAYSVDPAGTLFALIIPVKERSGLYLAKYKENGSLDAIHSIDLGDRLAPVHLEVFANGQMLISGMERIEKTSLTLMFDANGGNPRTVRTQEAQADTSTPELAAAFQRSLRLSMTALGPDRNLYVARQLKTPLVLVISPAGELLRQFTVEPPSSGLMVVALRQDAARLALDFRKVAMSAADFPQQKRATVRIVDANTGQPQADYLLEGSTYGSLACYSAPDELSVLTLDGNGEFFHLKKVGP
jgi:hypothetical protein